MHGGTHSLEFRLLISCEEVPLAHKELRHREGAFYCPGSSCIRRRIVARGISDRRAASVGFVEFKDRLADRNALVADVDARNCRTADENRDRVL